MNSLKKSLLFFLTFMAFTFSINAQEQKLGKEDLTPVVLNSNETSGIPNARYTAVNEKGITFGFDFQIGQRVNPEKPSEMVDYLENVVFYGALPSQALSGTTEIIVPQNLTYNNGDKTLKGEVNAISLEFNYGYDKSLGTFTNLSDIYLPETVSQVRCSGNDILGFMNLHFRSKDVPDFNFENSADQRIKLYILDPYYDDYDRALAPYNYFLCYESPAKEVKINIVNPGTLAEEIYQYLENLNSVRHLTISGVPNEEDMLVVRRMEHLETLDLREAKITKIEKCNNLKYLEHIYLPEGLIELGENAFSNSPSLQNLQFPSTVKTIQKSAFQECINLSDIEFSSALEYIGSAAFAECKNIRELKFPISLRRIGTNSFYNCSLLENIILNEGLEIIGEPDEWYWEMGAFRGTNIKKLVLPSSLHTIGDGAFNGVPIEEVNLENLKHIGGQAFNNCKLREINLINIESLGDGSFSENPYLKSVKFGDKLTTITYGCFNLCGLEEIYIPDNILTISNQGFSGNPLKKIVLSRNITSLASDSFGGCTPEIVICPILFPLDQNGFGEVRNTTLYVPYLSINAYLMHDSWMNFRDIQPIPDSEITDITIDRPFTLRTNNGLADKANITNQSAFTIGRKAPINLTSFISEGKAGYYNYHDEQWQWHYGIGYNKGATLIVETVIDETGKEIGTDIKADNVTFNLTLETGRWHFLTFPFDINVKDIKVNDDALWVVRRYSGEDRAKLTNNTWQNMTENDVLKAGEGYIFHCQRENYGEVNFSITPTEETKNNLFIRHDFSKPLQKYPAEFAHNDSWNLVGNAYPAYINIKGIEFDGPITVWDGNTYWAYSPNDDELILYPFQAFFVQRHDWEGGETLNLKANARAHSVEDANNMYEANDDTLTRSSGSEERAIFNLMLSGKETKDRVRAIVNNEAKMEYEIRRDAAKFLSSEDVPQIYILNKDVKMAIDERPYGNGEFLIGTRFGQDGNYTISLDTKDAEEFNAYLIDKKTGVTTDLNIGSYEFKAEKGEDEDRFILSLNTRSGVESVSSEDIKISLEGNILYVKAPESIEILVAGIDGSTMTSCKSSDFKFELPEGIYIVKAGNKVVKTIVSK